MWYEIITNVKVLIHVSEYIDDYVNRILFVEIQQIKNMIDDKKSINFFPVNTSAYNNDGRVGDNLHYLIKSIF